MHNSHRPQRWPHAGQLVLSAQTLDRAALDERLDATAAAGFTRIGLRPRDYDQAGRTDKELRAALADRGLELVELSALPGWGQSADAGQRSRLIEERMYRMSAALGGEYIVAFTDLDCSHETAVERYGALCDRAARHGLKVALEFAPFTSIVDAASAYAIVKAASRPNGGVLIDSWHHFRGAANDAMLLEIPAEEIIAIHLDDAPMNPETDLVEETTRSRLLPGEGSFALPRFLGLLAEHGVHAPIAVEVLSDRLRAMPAATVAKLAYSQSVNLIDAARGDHQCR